MCWWLACQAMRQERLAARLEGQNELLPIRRIDFPSSQPPSDDRRVGGGKRGGTNTPTFGQLEHTMAAEHDDMDLSIDESDPDNLFHVPEARPSANKVAKNKSSEPSEASKQRAADSEFGNENSIEVALRQELENVRKINQVVEGVIKGLEKAQGNMEVRACTLFHITLQLMPYRPYPAP